MDDQQNRILDDLRDIVKGDILVDDLSRAAYSTDASILQVRPLGIVAPRTVDELAGVVKYASENGISIHPRGAGTGLAGESLGPGLVVDSSRYLNAIVESGPHSVKVQPGVRCADLQKYLARQGRMFAPDPVSADRCTIGGMLATDAAGPHSLRYGSTRDHVLSLKAVLAGGEIVPLGREPIGNSGHPDPLVGRIAGDVAALLTEYASVIESEQPANLLKPGGYNLRGVLHTGHVELHKLLVGSEGTLALFAEAELATVPKPEQRGILIGAFSSLEAAADAVLESLDFRPSACEMIDRRLLSVIREAHPAYRKWLPPDAEAMVLVEHDGASENEVLGRLRSLREAFRGKLARETIIITREPELTLCWQMRDRATPDLTRLAGNLRPVAFVENTAVPPAKLSRFLKRVQNIMKRHGVTAAFAAHLGVGIVHTRPLLDIRRADHISLLEAISAEVFEAVLECGGSNNGEHGVGLLRSYLLPRQFPKLFPAFSRLKAIFDPHNRLNPGRLVAAASGFPIRDLRIAPRLADPAIVIQPQLRWAELPLADMAERCNGCSACSTSDPTIRMCPSFKAMDSELASPRSKANLMRQIVTGALDPRLLGSDDFRKVADLCVNCKMCRVECPSGVDISKLMLDAKATNAAEQGLSRTDAFFARLDAWSRSASANSLLANALLKNRTFRFFAEKWWGLSRHRRMPRFHHKTFLRRAIRNGWTRKPRSSERKPKVAFFADTFVNCNDPHLGECAVRVLEHHGRKVYVPPTQGPSGMAPLTYGDIEAARAALEWNIKTFADLARDGFDIVATEPAAALMFRDDARNLINDPDLDLLAERTFEFTEYMGIIAESNQLRTGLQPIPLTVAYHDPCHQRALLPRASSANLLSHIPELRLIEMDHGCSGMAGTFGMRADSYEASLAAGAVMLDRFRGHDIHMGATQCSACRLQMEQGAGKRTLHPAKWLAVAYGLVQRPEKLFARPDKELAGR